jgi:hypothetical protein
MPQKMEIRKRAGTRNLCWRELNYVIVSGNGRIAGNCEMFIGFIF